MTKDLFKFTRKGKRHKRWGLQKRGRGSVKKKPKPVGGQGRGPGPKPSEGSPLGLKSATRGGGRGRKE